MKNFLVACLLLAVAASTVFGQSDQGNVLSYYAIVNGLDGQPLIDRMNILRFHPVFALRKTTDQVRVTVYYGSRVYIRDAAKLRDGLYWEVLLPEFRLGEAIQKIEVEAHFRIQDALGDEHKKLMEDFSNSIELFKSDTEAKLKGLQAIIDGIKSAYGADTTEVARLKRVLKDDSTVLKPEWLDARNAELNDSLKLLSHSFSDSWRVADSVLKKFMRDSVNNRISNLPDSRLDSTVTNWVADSARIYLGQMSEHVSKIINFDQTRLTDLSDTVLTRSNKAATVIDASERNVRKIAAIRDGLISAVNKLSQMQTISRDSLIVRSIEAITKYREKFASEVGVGLQDTTYVGPSVTLSDLVMDPDYRGATILYRNYKGSLRKMPALDPTERLGIFRARFVPFPITSESDTQKVTALFPGQGAAETVFEVGLSFGDATVPSDETVLPAFSFQRLGVVIAITEKLFAEDAPIKALAFSYDFNSYASISVGANFAPKSARAYYSLGINKKAFEALLVQLPLLFK